MQFYRLNENKEVVPCSRKEFEEMWHPDNFETHRRVAFTKFEGDIEVSTVFMGIRHAFNSQTDEPEDVFETMIFTPHGENYCKRSSTWNKAMEEHEIAVAYVKSCKGL